MFLCKVDDWAAVIENNEADGHLDQKKLRYIEAEVLCCLEKLQIVPLFCITDFIYIVKLNKKLGKILWIIVGNEK